VIRKPCLIKLIFKNSATQVFEIISNKIKFLIKENTILYLFDKKFKNTSSYLQNSIYRL
jgi:hypothetical protein